MTPWRDNVANAARPHVPEDELHAYCDGELSPSQRVEIAEHLLSCLICRSLHGEVEEVRARVALVLAIASPLQYGRPPMRNTQHAAGRRAPRGLMAAAVAVIGVGVWFSFQPATAARGTTQLATSLGLSGFFELGHGGVDQAAIRDRELTMASRATAVPRVLVGPATIPFAPPTLLGTAAEVDPVVTSEWTVATVDDALKAADGKLPHVPDIPVRLVRIHPSAVGGRPTFLIRQQLPDGHFIWVVEGLERDIAPVDQLVQASGIAMSMPARTRPDYVDSGTGTAITVRMVRVVGYLPVDSLNALARKLALR
jgi:anti-sigma factor RsiW